MGPEYFMNGGFFGMWIFPVFFIIMMIWMMGRRGSGCDHSSDNHQAKSESAKDILDKRYAKGEISQLEYEEMKKTLNS